MKRTDEELKKIVESLMSEEYDYCPVPYCLFGFEGHSPNAHETFWKEYTRRIDNAK